MPQKFVRTRPRGAARVPPHRCGGCGNRWSGRNTAHCGACHVTFSGLTAFDLHRVNHTCRTVAEMQKFGYRLMPRDGWTVLSKPGEDEV